MVAEQERRDESHDGGYKKRFSRNAAAHAAAHMRVVRRGCEVRFPAVSPSVQVIDTYYKTRKRFTACSAAETSVFSLIITIIIFSQKMTIWVNKVT